MHAEFLRFADKHPDLVQRSTFSCVVDYPGMEGYHLQGWPTWVSRAELALMEKASVAICRLVKSLPDRVFGGDHAALADFFDLESEAQATLLLESPNGIEGAIARIDFIQTPAGMKCLEVNLGNLGMWQATFLCPRFLNLPIIQEFLHQAGLRAGYTNAVSQLFRHVIDNQLDRHPDWSGDLNLAIVVSPDGHYGPRCHPLDFYREEYARLLAERGLEGQVFVLPESEIQERRGSLVYEGTRLHLLVEQHYEFTTQKLFRAFKSGAINLFNGAIDRIIGDKRNLAILSEFSESPIFTAEERSVIREFVPWTRIVTAAETGFRGQTLPMAEVLREQRADLVLKQGQSFGGNSVVIGAHSSDDSWRAACNKAIDEAGCWIVQELIPPRRESYLLSDGQTCRHDMVWGMYVFRNAYAGAVMRMIPSESKAIINLSQGATVGLLYEVEPIAVGRV